MSTGPRIGLSVVAAKRIRHYLRKEPITEEERLHLLGLLSQKIEMIETNRRTKSNTLDKYFGPGKTDQR